MRQSEPPIQIRPRRILMTTDTVGGVWTYSVELARALAAHGVSVALATMGTPLNAGQRREIAAVGNVDVFESTFKLEWMDDPWRDVERAGDWLLELEAAVKPDVVHLNGYAHGALPWKAPVLVVGHSCVLSWWRAVKGGAAPERWDRYRREVRRGLQAGDLIAAPTVGMLKELRRDYGPFREEAVVPNGRGGGMSIPVSEKRAFVCTAGRIWDEAKNVAALEHVAPSLPWRVLVAGETRHPEGGSVRETKNVRYLGRLSGTQLATCFGYASIYALPARYEPFGLSVVEAALAECALVLGDIPTLREVWRDAAVYVPPDDTEALERALMALIRDEGERRRMARRAREAVRRYTPARMANGYAALYRSLLTRRDERRTTVSSEGMAMPAATLRQF